MIALIIGTVLAIAVMGWLGIATRHQGPGHLDLMTNFLLDLYGRAGHEHVVRFRRRD